MTSIALLGDLVLPRDGPRGAFDRDVLDLLAGADARLGNLEVPLTRTREPGAKLCPMRSEPSTVALLCDLGLDYVSLANNHAMDQGPAGLAETRATLRRSGIAASGAGDSLAEAVRPAWLTVAGRRVAVLSASMSLPPDSAAGPGRPGVAPVRVTTTYGRSPLVDEIPGWPAVVSTSADEGDVETLEAAVAAARADADLVLVALHWGVRTLWGLADYQRPLAHRLVAAGADAIVGHHPHVVHGVEFHRGRPILYSIGHFLCVAEQVRPVLDILTGPEAAQWDLSVVAFLDVTDRGFGVELVALHVDEEGWPHRATGRYAQQVEETVRAFSRDLPGEFVAGDGGVAGEYRLRAC